MGKRLPWKVPSWLPIWVTSGSCRRICVLYSYSNYYVPAYVQNSRKCITACSPGGGRGAQSGRDVKLTHSLPSSAEVNNKWNFPLRLHSMQRVNFTYSIHSIHSTPYSYAWIRPCRKICFSAHKADWSFCKCVRTEIDICKNIFLNSTNRLTFLIGTVWFTWRGNCFLTCNLETKSRL
jgi:hypothetical protein